MQRAVGAGGKIPQPQGADGNATQVLHFVPESGEDPANLAILPFSQHDLQLRRFRTRLQNPCTLHLHMSFGDIDPLTHLLHCFTFDLASHGDTIDFLHAEFWMGKSLRQFAIVGQQDQAFAVEIQPANRKDTFASGDQFDHPRASLGVGVGRDKAHGLVHRVIDQFLFS